ncbi:sugar nucleotidyltransferase [Nonomuraea sp. CA-218870]|uniref:sugar nucleotidyltransferase n=1 Tax=Nonomuraea sp. CA-218870 TaxID=3239998 RepID=UPI003D8B87B6
MKGIVLAGGTGSRLAPMTSVVCKQLLPVYDKPMIYYPISVLMQAGITDLLIISTPAALPLICELLGDGSRLGLSVSYAEQEEPRGIADAFLVGEKYLSDSPAALVLGDNLFAGDELPALLWGARRTVESGAAGAVLFGREVSDPRRYAVAAFDARGAVTDLVEKPADPPSACAVTGVYFYDADVVEMARRVRPSARGELEITDLNRLYLERGDVQLVGLGEGCVWHDMGTPASLLEAGHLVRAWGERGTRVGCLEEIALRMGFIDADTCAAAGLRMKSSPYGRHLLEFATQWAG